MAQARAQLRPHQSSLIWAGIAALVMWVVPYFGLLLLPLQYLNTHLHEFCHAFAAVLSGGSVAWIKVFAGGGGLTLSTGSPYLVSSAGYLGATIIGALLIRFSVTERGAAIALRLVAILMLFSMIFWVRGDWVGGISGLMWPALLFVLAHYLKDRAVVFAAQFLGMLLCLSSVQSLYELVQITTYTSSHSDAGNMQRYTGIPAIFWAVLWSLIGLAAVLLTLRSAWKPQARV